MCSQFKEGRVFKSILSRQESKHKGEDWKAGERQKAIRLLLENREMDNQTKLATYALWYFHGDHEMEVAKFDMLRNELGMNRSQYFCYLLSGQKKQIPGSIRYKNLIAKLSDIDLHLRCICLKEDMEAGDILYVHEARIFKKLFAVDTSIRSRENPIRTVEHKRVKMNKAVRGLRDVIEADDVNAEGLLTGYFYELLNRR